MKEMSDKFQVLIRCFTFNHRPYIEDALKGFVMQKTSFKFCALIVDDCSTDETAAVIREYENKYPDIIKGIYLKENYYGRSKEKWELISPWRSVSKYEALCEGDDFWTDPYKLQKQFDFLESHPGKSLVYTNCNVFFHQEKKLYESVFSTGYFKPTLNYKDFLLEGKYLAPCTWFYKTEDYDVLSIPSFVTDGTLWLAFHLLVENKVGYLNDTTSTYRVVHGSASHSNDLSKRYKYLKGVFETEIFLLTEYKSFFSMEDRSCIYQKRYLDLLPFAVALNDEDVLHEIRTYKFNKIDWKYKMMMLLSNVPIARRYVYKKMEKSIQKGL